MYRASVLLSAFVGTLALGACAQVQSPGPHSARESTPCDGCGVSQDSVRAAQLYEQACDGGDMARCTNLGALYQTGQGVSQDSTRAVQLYEQACQGGSMPGCSNLGVLYEAGHGVRQDYTRAAQLFEQACQGGYSNGCTAGERLRNGGR